MNRLFIIVFICSATHQHFGTGQTSELIIFEGDTLALLSLPLEDYLGEFDDRDKYHPALKSGCSTALWRGYVGLWKIENSEFFLIDVYVCGQRDKSIFKKLFDSNSPIKADWFSGNLFIQHGKMLKYNHSGFARYFEEETVIKIEQGNLISQHHYVNGFKPDDRNLSSNPDSVMAEFYKRINWKALPKLSKDYIVFIELKLGEVDSLTIIRSSAPELYEKEVQRIIDEFPKLRKFYSRGEPLEEGYILPVIFTNYQRKRFAR